MKYRQLYAELIAADSCYVVRNGGNHDMWFSPITGNIWPIPRHGAYLGA